MPSSLHPAWSHHHSNPTGARRSPAFVPAVLNTLAVLAALIVPVGSLPGQPGPASAPAYAAPPSDEDLGKDGSALRSAETKRVAPGLELTNFSRLEDGGWNNGNVLTADLTTEIGRAHV